MIDTNALRKKVLDLAIRGKLVPQNPNDEPASILLERIREEKQRLIREGKIKKDKVDSIIFRGEDNCHYEKIGDVVKKIEDEIPFVIPKTWCWVRFPQIVSYKMGKTPERANISFWKNGNIPWISISDMESGRILLSTKEKITEKAFDEKFDAVYSPAGTLIMSFKLTVGRTSILGVNAVHNEAIISIFPYLNYDNIIRDYLLKTLEGIVQFVDKRDAIKGITLNSKKLDNMLIPLPPLNEQRRILDFWSKAEAEIIKLEQNQIDYYSLVDSLKKAILQSAIQGKLVEQDGSDEPASELLARIRAEKRAQLGKKYVESYIFKGVDNRYYEHIGDNDKDINEEIPFDLPNNWCFTRLNEYLDVRDGTHDSPKYCESGYPLVTSKNLSNGAIDFSTAKMISEKDYIAINERSFVDNNDILFAMIGSIGNPVLVKKDRDFAIKNMALFKQRTLIQNMEYMLYYFTYIQDSLRRKTSGALQPFISLNFFRNLIIPIPPLAEQERIVSKINEIFAQL